MGRSARRLGPSCGSEASKGRFLAIVSLNALGGISSESTGAEPSIARNEFALTVTSGSRLAVAAQINGETIEALLDSAAEMTILDSALLTSRITCSGLSLWTEQRHECAGS